MRRDVTYSVSFNDNCAGANLAQTAGLASGSSFPSGTTSNSFTVTDGSGNTSTCSFTVTVNDTEIPTITCPANVVVSNDPGQCAAMVTYSVSFNDNCAGANLAQTAGLASGSSFPSGTTSNTFVVTDGSGNIATCSFNVTVNDNEVPTITCPANVVVSNDPGQCAAIVTYSVTFNDNCAGANLAQTAGLASGSSFPSGTTSNSFTVTDSSGNTAACSFTVAVNDTEIPTITCPANVVVSNDPGQCAAIVTYSVTFNDNCGGANLAQTAGLASGSSFPSGTTSNSYTVTDGSGNTATCSFTVTVNDAEIPTITCPANVVVSNDPGQCAAIVTYSVSFNDNCAGANLAQTAGLASGSSFPSGTTSNSFTVTDGSGNTAACSFTVTVNDTEIPTITCPANVVVSNDPGLCAAIVTYSVSFNDNCAGATLAQTAGLASGSSFPTGVTSNSFSVTDGSVNTAACSFTVTVNDTEIPTITCPANVVVSNDPGQCAAIVTYSVSFNDNCAGANLAQTAGLASGSSFPSGTTANSFTVTDGSGNTATCSFTVTVNDTEIPTITCPANVVVSNDPGQCAAIVTYSVSFNDNCAGANLAQTAGLASGSSFPAGLTSNSYTVTDGSGNTAACSFTVTVNDTEIPTITCPANVVVSNDPGQCAAIVTYSVSFNDNCSGANLAQTAGLASGSSFPSGTTSNSFTVTDGSGNTATCSFTVTVNDTEIPTITCPANVVVSNDPGQCAAIVTYSVSFNDNCSGANLTQTAGLASGSSFPTGVTSNSFTVTDASGNTATCSFTVTVNDTEIPTITCPANVVVSNDPGQCAAIVTYSVSFNDNCAGANLAQTAGLASGSSFPTGVTSNSFTVTDGAGNTATCSFTVTVNDTEIPTITCPANVVISNDPGQCAAIVTYSVSFNDNCAGANLAQTAGLASGSSFPTGVTSNSFTVTDGSGNTATCSFTVTVNDTEIPTITCPANVVVSNDPGQCAAIVTYSVTFNDNCAGANLAQTAGLASGSSFPSGTTANSFTVTDGSGNTATCSFTVTVNDTEAPTITCPANVVVSNDPGQCAAIVTYSVSFNDNCAGANLAQTAGLASGSSFPSGTTSNSFTVTDGSGNTAACSFTVTVNDTEIPTITCPANVVVSNDPGQCAAMVTYSVSFNDNCAGATLAQTAGLASGSSFPSGTTSNSFTVTDGSGNTATCSFTVTVNDMESPTITCPANVVVSNDPGQCAAIVTYSVSFNDNCAGANLAQTSGLASGSSFPTGVTSNSFTVTDGSGNTAACSFTVTVNDTETPTITCPANVVVSNDPGQCAAMVTYSVSFNDNCAGATLAQTAGLASGSSFPSGTTSNSFTVTDGSGNTATCSFTVTVNDMESPTITCPANVVVSNDPSQCAAIVTYSVSFNDNCAGANLAQTAGLASGSSFPTGVTSNSFTVTDGSGNTATCSFTVTVNDTEIPTITCPANVVVSNDPGQCTAIVTYSVSFNDNCAGATLAQTAGLTSGSSFPSGTTSNSFTVTDGSGNTAACSFTVTVNDTEIPTITCPANVVVSNDPGQCSAIVTYLVSFNDNCAGANLAQTAGLASGSSFPSGTTSNSFTVTDGSGNTATCSFTVTVNDTEVPTITCPANVVVSNDPGQCAAIVTYSVSFNDNCAGANLAQTAGLVSGSSFPSGTTSNSFTVTDGSGNTATCSFTVTVNDTESPTITCPANVVVSNDPGQCTAIVTYSVSFNDNCAGANLAQTAGLASGSSFTSGTTSNSYTVTDGSGNTAACSFTVTVNDTQIPTITCPASVVVSNDPGQCAAIVTYSVSFNDNCAGANLAQTAGLASGSSFPSGTTSNSFTVTDGSGNTAACSFTVTVNDTEAPTITCPANVVVSNDPGQCAAIVTYSVNFNDNCAGANLAQTAGLASGSSFPSGLTSNSFTVTDGSGNTAACSFTVTVNDTEIPTITCPANVVVSNDPGLCAAIVTYSVSFNDNCAGANLAQTAGFASGSSFPSGTTSNSFTVTDGSGNTAGCSFTVTVNDTEIPTITCPANLVVSNDPGQCAAMVTYSVTFTDNCGGANLAQTAGLASGSSFPSGTTSNSFTVTDGSGNTAACSFTVTVNDTEAPTITCPANVVVSNDPGQCAAIVTYSVSFNDNCAGANLAQTAGLASGSSFPSGTTSNSFTVTDGSGNTAICSFTVTVNDTEIPTITCPANVVVSNDPGQCAAIVTYSVSFNDNCAGANLAQTAGLASGSSFPSGVTSNSFTVTDGSGNTATCSFTVTVNDTEAPTITCPANVVVSNDPGQCAAIVTYSVSFNDNCAGANLAQTAGLASGSSFPSGTTSNSFTVTDGSGNTAGCSFTVTVNDTEIPTITCPANLVVSNDPGQCAAMVTYSVTFTDNCGGANLAQTAGLASGSSFPSGTTSNSFTVTDGSGNTAACSFTVTVNDTEAPTITCPANVVVSNDPGQCAAIVTYSVSFNDNCAGANLAQTAGLVSGSSFPSGTTSNSFTVTDGSGNTAICSFTVTVNDTEIPTITCPANVVVSNDPGQCAAIVTYSVSFNDNCAGANLAQTAGLASGSSFPSGVTSNSFTVTDGSGNTATCSFTVTVNDTEAPTITCPANVVVSNDPGQCAAIVTYSVSFNDNCAGANLAQTAGLASGSSFPSGTTSNTFVVTDGSGNTATCSFTVTVNDTEIPTITCPANVVVSNDPGQCAAIVTYSVSFNDNCAGANLAQTAGLASGSSFPSGTTSNSFTVTDGSGNSATCSFTVTVNDTEIPTITCPANVVVSNDPGQCAAIVTYSVTFNDNCAGANLAQTAGLASGSSFPSGTTSNSFTVTDGSGNTATCSFTVTVNDTEGPVLVCQNIQVAPSPGPLVVTPAQVIVSASDNCGISTNVLTPNSFTCAQAGQTITVDLAVTDVNGNVSHCTPTVEVLGTGCNQPPVAICQNVTVNADVNCERGVVPQAFDNGSFDPNGDPLTFTTNPAGPFIVGVTNVVLTVSDGALTSTCSATVTVLDITPPTIRCPLNVSVSNDPGICGAIVGYTAVTGTDDCSGITIVQTSGLVSGGTFPIGTTLNGFTATDGAGNSAVCSFEVTVLDTENPILTCPGNLIETVDSGICAAVINYNVVLNDNCPGATLLQISGQPSGATIPLGTVINEFRAVDGAGNTSSCVFSVEVVDLTPPVAVCQNITVSNGINGNFTITPSMINNGSSDGCGIDSIFASQTAFTCSNNGGNVVVLTVTDIYGNTSTCSSIVTILGITPPVITPSGPTVFCSGGSVILNGGAGYNSYMWSNSATTQSITVTTSGYYGLAVVNNNGCIALAVPVAVTVNPSPTPVITASGPTTFCVGGSVTLDAGAGFASYNWSNGATTRTILVNATGNYTVTVTNGPGCPGIASRTVTVNPLPTVNITANNNGIICFGNAVTLTATAGLSTYAWSGGGTAFTKVVTTPGTYTVTVTNAFGCANTASFVVTAVNACQVPTGEFADNITSNGATLNWTAVPCATSYRVQWRRVGTNPYTSRNVSTNSTVITGLLPNTTYEWHVRTTCTGGGGTTAYSALFQFTTLGPQAKGEIGAEAEAAAAPDPMLYPNPNSGKFTLEYFAEVEAHVQICVYDMFGKLVRCETKLASESENTWEMQFDNLSKGMYMLKVEGVEQGLVETQSVRFIVQ